MYKTILVHVDADDPSAADRIRCAAQLARDHHGSLIGAAASMPTPILEFVGAGGPILAGGIMTAEPHELDNRFSAALDEFSRHSSGFNVETSWRTVADFPASGLAGMAGAADLIVVGPHSGSPFGSGYRSVDCGDLVISAGRPVLLVPDGISKLESNGAVVAWSNMREARRALMDALPLLATAEQVLLLHVREAGEEETDRSLADAKTFLDGHSIESDACTIGEEGGGIAARIIDFAKQSQSSLIVAGVYGHTRVQEWAFGGVTRDLLKMSPIACLFSR